MKHPAIALLLVAIVVPLPFAAPATGDLNAPDAYEFPVRPGTAAWKEFQTHDQMLAACQVPDDVLAAMSTPGLAKTCLMYPLAYDFMAFNTLDQGIETVISRFNGLQELMRRDDGASALLAEYQAMDPKTPPDCPYESKSPCRFQWMYVETLLGRDAILNRLTAQERVSLLEACQANASAKRNDPQFGMIHLRTVGELMGRVLIDVGYEPFVREYDGSADMKAFLQGAPQASRDTFDAIVSSVDRYLARTTGREVER